MGGPTTMGSHIENEAKNATTTTVSLTYMHTHGVAFNDIGGRERGAFSRRLFRSVSVQNRWLAEVCFNLTNA